MSSTLAKAKRKLNFNLDVEGKKRKGTGKGNSFRISQTCGRDGTCLAVHEETSEKYNFDFNMPSPIVGSGDPTLESFERIDHQKQH